MSTAYDLREERAGDELAIAALVDIAFAGQPHSSGTEAAIVNGLRRSDALTVSLVAEATDGQIVGHVAFSPVLTGGRPGWHALAPLSVLPAYQRLGIGAALATEGLLRLQALGSSGCVLVGDPAYYSRFGFLSAIRLTVAEPMQPYLQVLALEGKEPSGEVTFHAAFQA